MSNILHAEMLRQFAAEISRPARDLIAMASLMQVARQRSGPTLVNAHWGCLREHARRLNAVLGQWAILGITLAQLRFWEDAPLKAALVRAVERWGALPRCPSSWDGEHEEADRFLHLAALQV